MWAENEITPREFADMTRRHEVGIGRNLVELFPKVFKLISEDSLATSSRLTQNPNHYQKAKGDFCSA